MAVEHSVESNETCLDKRPTKKSRACLHCHVRKVRCNAWEVGIPCTRCCRRNEASTCVLVAASHRDLLGYVIIHPSLKSSHQGQCTELQRKEKRRTAEAQILFVLPEDVSCDSARARAQSIRSGNFLVLLHGLFLRRSLQLARYT